ncbi:appetite-regulating hormone [Mus pahari]|uniref:appetite-regulating hormone n=1 Tax=Mus pahari TaxID=10093 RepID=UPI001114A6A5|nr:appetite-regulating hormone [Mus pahari]
MEMTLSPRSSVLTTKTMLSSGTICSLLLLSMLWMDMAMAGSSFLSPEHQKAQVSLSPQARHLPQCVCVCGGGGNVRLSERKRTPCFPFQQRKESKKPPAKLQPRALEGWLHPEDRGQAEETEEELEIRFNAPFDVGIKLSGAQYQQHGRALGKFLQDILWEEVKGKGAELGV